MNINVNEEIKELVVGGQSYDVSQLSNEQIGQLAKSLGIQDNASQQFHASTGVLEFVPKTGSKGADRNLSRIFEDLRNEDENEIDDYDDYDEDEIDDFYDEDDEYELSPEEIARQEWLESFVIPAHHFSQNDLKYFEQNEVDVTDLSSLTQAKVRIDQIEEEYMTRTAKEFADQFLKDEINVKEFIEQVSQLSL